MPIWNVARVVIANVEAETAEEAESILDASLIRTGYLVHDTADTGTSLDAFEADADTIVDDLP